MVELNQLVQLVTIAETGTVSKAADILHLSQPALSRSMQRLESELQVPLFDRQKNKLSLNANGEMALEYARQILAGVSNMSTKLQAFERSHHILSIGACAPAPLWQLSPILSRLHADMTIQSEIKPQELLLSGLLDNIYQIVITTEPSTHPDILSYPYMKEKLFASLVPSHPFANHKELSLSDLNGHSAIILSNIGFWENVCREKMPDSLFLIQDDVEMLHELRKSSTLVAFSTDITMRDAPQAENRLCIPLTDPEVDVTYYCNIKSDDQKRFNRFISTLN